MTGKTHGSTAVIIGEGFALASGITNPMLGIAAGIGGLMPDIDTSHSTVSIFLQRKIFYLVLAAGYLIYEIKVSATILYYLIPLFIFLTLAITSKHRTFTHSLLGIVLFSFSLWILSLKLPKIVLDTNISIYVILITAGYILHILEDMLTVSGVPLLYPFSKKSYRLVSKKVKIKTNGKLDNIIGIISIIIVFALYFYHYTYLYTSWKLF